MPIYWHDNSGIVLGINENCLSGMGTTRSNIIGRSPYDFHHEIFAERILKHNKQIMESGKTSSQEEVFIHFTTGELVYAKSIKAPLYDNRGSIIGVIGMAIDITAEKTMQELRIQNPMYQAELKTQDAFKSCMNSIQNLLQNTRIKVLNDTVGTRPLMIAGSKELKLTEREGEVLYLISMGKSPKEIANILSKVKNKKIAHSTIGGMINKKLYVKFGVSTTSRLIEKASMLKLIPFLHDSFVGY